MLGFRTDLWVSKAQGSGSGSDLSQAGRLLSGPWLPGQSSLECDGNSSAHHSPLACLAGQMACDLS